MGEYTIQNLQEVLTERITKDKKITDTKISALTAPGENFGSIMLKLLVSLKNEKDGTEEEVHAVAKTLPAQEFTRKIFNVQVTFKNEIAMYDTIVPTLQSFQRENGIGNVIDCFPELYGARINLGGENGTVDDNAALILENLNDKGYRVVDRHIGFDLETAKLILKDLAAFHAIPLALKLRKPEVFDKKIRPYLSPFRPPSMPHADEHNSVLIEILEDSYKCIPYMPKLKEIFKNVKTARDVPPREPFATVTHGDMWVNNTMVKFEDGLPVHNKLVDFQVCDYRSPAADLFFFLFTSVQLTVLQENLDNLIEYYHTHFISHLEQLKCDISPFSLPHLLDEIRFVMPVEIPHVLGMMMFIVFGKKGGPSKEFDHSMPPDLKKMKENISSAAKDKARFTVHTVGKKGWLQ